MFSYNILLDLITSFACIVFAFGLLRFWNRNKSHVLFSLLSLCLAVGFLFRSAYLFQSESIFPKIAYLAFSIFPIILTLFIEKSSGRLAARGFKLFQIFSVLFITFPLLNRGIRLLVPWWIKYFMFYHLICVIYVSYFLWLVVNEARGRQEKNIFLTLLVGVSISSAFIAMDWLSRIGYDLPQISALPLLLMIYLLTSIFYGQAGFSFYFELIKLGLTASFSFVVAFVGVFYMGLDHWAYVYDLALVLFLFLVCGQFITKQFRFNYERRLPELFRQLNFLPKSDLQVYIKSLKKLDLIQNLRLLDGKDLSEKDCTRYISFFKENPHTISKEKTEKMLKSPNISVELKNQLQELSYIMEMSGTNYICPVADSDKLLSASSVKLMDPFGYEQLLEIASDHISLIASREKRS